MDRNELQRFRLVRRSTRRFPHCAAALLLAPFMVVSRPAAAENKSLDKVFISPVQSSGLNKDMVDAVFDLLVVAVSRAGTLGVVTIEDVKAQLRQEQLKDAVGCSDVSCATELAGALGVRYLLSARARKMASQLMVTLTLIDTLEQHSRSSRGTSADKEEDYSKAVDAAVAEVLGQVTTHLAVEAAGPANLSASDATERRKQLAWVIYAGLGGARYRIPSPAYNYGDGSTTYVGTSVDTKSFDLDIGVGLRQNFTRILGYQARVSAVAGWGSNGFSGTTGPVLALNVDATLRLGPVSAAFPWYVGIGPLLGLAVTTIDATGVGPLVGAVFETGFLVGENDFVDICARGFAVDAIGQDLSFGGMLVFGFRLGGP